ncbi:MAG TPA: V-type ATP synthase subunit D [Deltaproteobacteria bacterium]|nr:V-type ATP synthase subunit D [Deltaproteobacteria bacterium]HPP79703.1 V-type ATP synthase subunit D [Deltaproteobacteria bacterium]
MAGKLAVNPTRMELLKLRRKLAVAVRGHKLLKDKLEGLTREFRGVAELYRRSRREVDDELPGVLKLFVLAQAASSSRIVEDALEGCRRSLEVEPGQKRIMGVAVPALNVTMGEPEGLYSLVLTPPELDGAIERLRGFLPKLVAMAQLEETVRLLCIEIERTRRRVNALEHTFIPRMTETIRFITGKLDEMERSNTTRLMKIKAARLAQEPEGL